MTIKVLVDGVFYQIGRSGIARVWNQIFKQWINSGLAEEVTVVDRAGTLPHISGLRTVTGPAFSYTHSDRETMQALCDRVHADIFISTYYSMPVSTPAVLMVHDMIPEVLGWDLQEPMWRQKAQAIAEAKGFICVSQNTASDLTRIYPRADAPITITRNGCDFKPASSIQIDTFKQRNGLQRQYFLLSGTRTGYKNARLFFEAFAMLGDERANYDILCTGGGTVEPELMAMAQGAGVRVGILSEEDMICAYSGARALVYPSLYEGFGLPVLEAMACGCPVITTNVASLPEVGGNAPLYVTPGADAVERICGHMRRVGIPELREALIARGLAQAKKFTWKDTADGVYSTLVAVAQHHVKPSDTRKVHSTDQLLTLEKFDLALPHDHRLPLYQREHKMYDRFLPVLAKKLPPMSTVIDIGANCGDSLGAMVNANSTLEYLCVEPDDGFFTYLVRNAEKIRTAYPDTTVHTVQALVGHAGDAYVLDGTGGSKHALPVPAHSASNQGRNGAVHHSVPLDTIVRQVLDEHWQRVSLLKSDVDGFDHAVLASASEVIRQCKPMIFFECQATNENQHRAFKDCVHQLRDEGYSHFWLLDNYGNPMLQVSSADAVIQMFDYLWRQHCGKATRSMYYVDILAVPPTQQAIADSAIAALTAAY